MKWRSNVRPWSRILVVGALLAAVSPVVYADPAELRGRIVFNTSDNHHIYVLDLAAGTTTEISPVLGHMASPEWSPDGEWITFQGGPANQAQIWVMRADGSDLRQVTTFGGNHVDPCFSPDGTRIVFTQVYGAVYTIGFDGTGLANLGVNGGISSWAPDGDTISYTNWAQPTYNSDLFLYHLATGTYTRITSAGIDAFTSTDWSPDGKKIVAARRHAGRWGVAIMNADGSGIVDLTTDMSGNANFPCFTPDGRIVFGSDVTGDWDLWIMNTDGTGKRNLTNTPYRNELNPSATGPRDRTPPVIEIALEQIRMWPPNHKLQSAGFELSVVDDLDSDPRIDITVSSSEADEGRGDGDTVGDIQLRLTTGDLVSAPPGEGRIVWSGRASAFVETFLDLLLRAERTGGKAGRVYTIAVTATDAAGNVSVRTAEVQVAK